MAEVVTEVVEMATPMVLESKVVGLVVVLVSEVVSEVMELMAVLTETSWFTVTITGEDVLDMEFVVRNWR